MRRHTVITLKGLGMKHPMQKISEGRFVQNDIVAYLIENGSIDLNQLAGLTFSDEDREQFAQLIGYSLSGYGSLSYVSDLSYRKAVEMGDNLHYTATTVEIELLEKKLARVQDITKKLTTTLFRVHEYDLQI